MDGALLFIDATDEGSVEHEEEYNRPLQRAVAEWLHVPLEVVEQRWAAIDLIDTRLGPAAGTGRTPPSLDVILRELEKVRAYARGRWGQDLKEMHALIILDDGNGLEGVNSVAAGLAVQVARWTDGNPVILGVQSPAPGWWHPVDAIPDPHEDKILQRASMAYWPLPAEGSFVWFRRDVERSSFKVLEGMHGRVLEATEKQVIVEVIEPVTGDEAWDNQVVWHTDDAPSPKAAFYWDCTVFEGKPVSALRAGDTIRVSLADLEPGDDIAPDLAYVAKVTEQESGGEGYRLVLWLLPDGPVARTKLIGAGYPFPGASR